MKIALATSSRWPHLAPEESSLIPTLISQGIDARPAVWSDPSIDWSHFDRVVVRSCWDYHLRLDEFLRWVETVPTLRNPARVVRWNSHKSYLLELERKGVQIPGTVLVRKGAGEARAPMKQGRVIVKPAVSASAYETHLFDSYADASDDIQRLAGDHDVVIQEFIPEVIEDGEWSLVYFDRRFSHAVKKAPKSGDFRVQQELGGSALASVASESLLRTAQQALDAVEEDLLYARVDLVDTSRRGPLLMELELIEPTLFLATDPKATSRFAKAIAR
jgi:glutathione synthase/RimK-type ligase-like ATP-grasp enzyme